MKQLSEPMISLGAKGWFNLGSAGGGKSIITSILCKIALPSVFFSSLIYVPKKMLRNQSFDWSNFFIETIGGSSLWFTSSLTLAELILLLILFTRVKNIWFYFGIGMFTSFLGYFAFESDILICGNPNFPWFWKSSLSAVLYLSLGGLYHKYEIMLNKRLYLSDLRVVLFLTICYCLYCLFDFKAYNGGLTSSPLTFGSVILSILGIIVVVLISKKITSNKFTEYWGRNTLGLYFMCGAIPNTIAILLKKCIPVGFPMVLICCCLSFAIALVVVYILNRYLPFMFDIRKLRINHSEI